MQVRVYAGGQPVEERVLLSEREARLRAGAGAEAIVVNAGGHGFYRVRYAPDLLDALLKRLETLAPIERFNLVNDAWALAVAGLMPLTAYLDLTARFRGERDRNVWSVLTASLYALNRVVEPGDRRRLEALVRDRAMPTFTALGWTPRAGEDELTRQLRGDLVRALGVLGNDPGVQARAIDATFGVRALDLSEGKYAVMVEESALKGAGQRKGVAGPFANPRIEPFGPPKP